MSRSSKRQEAFSPDRTIHEPVRLQIVSYLATGARQVAFTELRDRLGLTAGNLSVQLRRLEEAGYVAISKTFSERKPLTRVSLTKEGLSALERYLSDLEHMISQLKETTSAEDKAE